MPDEVHCMEQRYVTGWVETAAGRVPRVAVRLERADRMGALRVRCAIRRMHYRVPPGVYAVGSPDSGSAVLVSANYKLSFDTLRRELGGMDAWIMVLDTRGINVWCSAGKGTFGTDEIVNRIERTGLERIVTHRKLILPQLSAPGVAAHEVKKRSGFSVVYGPVRAADIPAFLDDGLRAGPGMREVRFAFKDRLVLVPAEVAMGKSYLLLGIAGFVLLSGLKRGGYSTELVVSAGARSAANLALAYVAGTVVGPLLLPWLPGRSFSVKGLFAGAAVCLVSFFAGLAGTTVLEMAAWILLILGLSSFITMNFTGASTYTSMSGVKREMKAAVPLQLAGVVAGMGLWIAARFV